MSAPRGVELDEGVLVGDVEVEAPVGEDVQALLGLRLFREHCLKFEIVQSEQNPRSEWDVTPRRQKHVALLKTWHHNFATPFCPLGALES